MNSGFMEPNSNQGVTQLVDDITVMRLLKTAMIPQLTGKEQLWEFIVVRERDALDEIIEVHEYYPMLKEVSTALVICVDPTRSQYPSGYWIQDCAVTIQNILLAAVSNNLSACWLGIYPQPQRVEVLRRIFNMPDHILPFAVITLNHLTGEPRLPEQWSEIRLRHGKW